MFQIKNMFYAVCLVFLLAVSSNAAEHEVGAYPYYLQDEVPDVMYGDIFEVSVMCPMGLDTSWTPTLDTDHSGNFTLLEVQNDVRDEDVFQFWYPYPATVRFILKAGDENMGPVFFDGGNADYRLRFSVPTKNAEDQPISMLEPETPTDGLLNGILVKTVPYAEDVPVYDTIHNNGAVIRVGETYGLEMDMSMFNDAGDEAWFALDDSPIGMETFAVEDFQIFRPRGSYVGHLMIKGTAIGISERDVILAVWPNEQDYLNGDAPLRTAKYKPKAFVIQEKKFEFPAGETFWLYDDGSLTLSLINEYAKPGVDVSVDVSGMTHSTAEAVTAKDGTMVDFRIEPIRGAVGEDTLHVSYYDLDCDRVRMDTITIITNGYTGENPPGPDIPAPEPPAPGGGGGTDPGDGPSIPPAPPVPGLINSDDIRFITISVGQRGAVSFGVPLSGMDNGNPSIAEIKFNGAVATAIGLKSGTTSVVFDPVKSGQYSLRPVLHVTVTGYTPPSSGDVKPNPTGNGGGGGGCSTSAGAPIAIAGALVIAGMALVRKEEEK
jgi:hypothetical protein